MYRICVVEDEIKIQKELKLLLENANYEVAVIENFENVITSTPDVTKLSKTLSTNIFLVKFLTSSTFKLIIESSYFKLSFVYHLL